MNLYINAFKQGIARIFTLPRLSLPLMSTLGLTLAAVLTVLAVANTLLFQPLPDIDEKGLHQVELQMDFMEGFEVSFFSDPRRVASISKLYGEELAWGHITPDETTVELGSSESTVARFNATSGSAEVLGLTLLQGQGSDVENAEEGIWISKSLWQSAFNGMPDLSRQTLRMDGSDYPILGVFDDFISVEVSDLRDRISEQVWRFQDLEKTLETPDTLSLNIEPITVVRGALNAIPRPEDLQAWYIDYLNTDITNVQAREFLMSKKVTGNIQSYRDAFIGDSQNLVFLLIVAMVSLLVMACLNLLNMFIAHYQSRNKEFSIQICMGSSIRKLRSLIFTENLPMFLMATVIGLITAGWLIKILPVLAGDNLPLLSQIALNLNSVVIAIAVIALINLAFALIALVYVDKNALTDSLNSSGKGTPAQHKQAVSKLLMVVQLTLACVLLTSAVASVKKSYHDTYTDLGYSMPNAYEVSMQISDDTWLTSLSEFEEYRGSELQQVRDAFAQRLASLGGEVLNIPALPLTNNVTMNAYPDPETGDSMMIRPVVWGQGMLSAFDIELLAGRDLNQDDIGLRNILISKDFAVERAGNADWQSLAGSELKLGEEDDTIFNIVGIVEDIVALPTGAFVGDAPEIYFSSPDGIGSSGLTAVVILPEGQTLNVELVELALKGLDSRLSDVQVDAMQVRWQGATEASRLNMYVVMGLAGLTLVLAAIGVSGLSQMTAGQKRYELAVRMATGAKQIGLLRLLVKDSLVMLVVGLGLGVVTAVGAYQYLLGFFESAPAFDWIVTSSINGLLAIVMLLSIAIPGWAVIRKDPMRTLREL